jgi:tetratricopeptide (TPR) repeat protein
LFARGEEAYAASHFTQAAELFEQADAESPHPSAVYNAAVCWEQAGELARAADGYLEALGRGGLEERQAKDSETRLAALKGRLGFIQITKPVGGLASVAHKQREPIPARFYLAPGDYQVLLEDTSGATSLTPVVAVAGETLRVELSLPPPSEHSDEPKLPEPPVIPALPEEPHTPASRVLGWVGVALGLAAGGAAVYMGTEALAARDRYSDAHNSPRQRNEARDRAIDLQLGTNIAWGGATIFGGTGLVLLLASPTWEF